MPKKNSSNYWAERARQNKLNVIKIGENGINELKRVLKTNLDDVQKEIKAFYDKYGENPAEELSYKEFEEYKKNLKAKAKKYPDDKTLQRMMKQDIPKYRIDRLRQLEADLQIRLAEVTTYQQTSINGTLTDVAAVSHEATKKMMKEAIGLNIGAINSKQIEALISTDWSGKNWSERLWKDREKLGKKLKQTLEKGITHGIGYRKMARELKAEVCTSFNNAFRLIRTESAFIQGDINKNAYTEAANELGLDEYVYDAFLDSRTSTICRELDGKRFKISEMEIGVNAPPMHPNCRSTTQLALDGEKDINVAREGKVLKSEENPFNYKNFNGEVREMLQDIANSRDIEVQEIFKYANKLPVVQIAKNTGRGGFHPVGYTITAPDSKTLTHELGHWLDYGLTNKKDGNWLPFSYNSKEVLKNLAYGNADKLPLGVLNKLRQVQKMVDKDGIPLFKEQRQWNEISDIYDALTQGDLYSRGLAPFGHGREYYKDKSNQTTEIFAQYFSLRVYSKKEQLEFLSKYSPELILFLDKQFTQYLKEIKNL